jgi:osmotically-inducible protein OsmY
MIRADAEHAGVEALRMLDRVRRTLWDHEPLRESGSILEVEYEDGTVRLSGRVRTSALKLVAEYLARAAGGGVRVRNDVMSDPEVIRAVADALAADATTRPHILRVDARLGRARLSGIVPSASVEQRAIDVASNVPLVTGVVSEIEVDPQALEPELGVVVVPAGGLAGGAARGTA